MSDLKDNIMKKIHSDEVRMRSRSFFILLQAIGEIVLIGLFILLVYLINISIYIPQKRFMPGNPPLTGPREFFFETLPWPHIIISILIFAFIIWAIYHYTDLYKRNWFGFLAIVTVLILVLSYILAQTPLNRNLENRPNFRRFYPRRIQRNIPLQMLPNPNLRFD